MRRDRATDEQRALQESIELERQVAAVESLLDALVAAIGAHVELDPGRRELDDAERALAREASDAAAAAHADVSRRHETLRALRRARVPTGRALAALWILRQSLLRAAGEEAARGARALSSDAAQARAAPALRALRDAALGGPVAPAVRQRAAVARAHVTAAAAAFGLALALGAPLGWVVAGCVTALLASLGLVRRAGEWYRLGLSNLGPVPDVTRGDPRPLALTAAALLRAAVVVAVPLTAHAVGVDVPAWIGALVAGEWALFEAVPLALQARRLARWERGQGLTLWSTARPLMARARTVEALYVEAPVAAPDPARTAIG